MVLSASLARSGCSFPTTHVDVETVSELMTRAGIDLDVSAHSRSVGVTTEWSLSLANRVS